MPENTLPPLKSRKATPLLTLLKLHPNRWSLRAITWSFRKDCLRGMVTQSYQKMVFEASLEKLGKLHSHPRGAMGAISKAFFGVHIGVHDSAKMDKIGLDWGKLLKG